MKVLVACETSGVVRNAFLHDGHVAWSCDILPCDDGSVYHYEMDIFELLQDCDSHQWDLIIAHPPCTKLCVAGNKHYGEGKPRYNERIEAVNWTMKLWELCRSKAKRVCFENPVGILQRLGGIVKPQYVQPYQFGHMEQKKTALHLHNLPPLVPTNNVYDEMMKLPKNQRERVFYMPPSEDRWKIRSKTFDGIGEAMASQWGGYYETTK